jgi:acyl-CoA synthetase (AMP-forming)/AMP-acid ligase II
MTAQTAAAPEAAFLLWHHLRASARIHASRPAVVWRDSTLTYAELAAQSDRVAALLQARGIGRGSRVGLFMPKSHRSVVVMLGVMKAGAAYVPIDPHAPALRAAYILGDCAVRGLVTTAEKLRELRPHIDSVNSLESILLADDIDELPEAP